MTANEYTIRMAESYEKAAIQAEERSDRLKASEFWTKAGDGFVEAGKLPRAIECFRKTGVLEDRAIQLAVSSVAEAALEVLDAQQLPFAAALARLHLLSSGHNTRGPSAHAACLAAVAKTKEPARQLSLLTGAMLSAAWTDDMTALAAAADATLKLGAGQLETAILAKTAATVDFDLLGDLEKVLATNQEGTRAAYGPGQLRLLAPIHAWRGIRLVPLVDAMSSFPATRNVAKDYRELIAGLEGGDSDAALTQFVAGVRKRASRPDPARSIQSWNDAEKALATCFPVQPEAIAAAVLWDQMWAVRTSVRGVGEFLVAARRASQSFEWSTVFETVDALLNNRVFSYLPHDKQIEIYRLGCTAAFSAEHWERYDAWARILEAQYGVKAVLHEVLSSGEA